MPPTMKETTLLLLVISLSFPSYFSRPCESEVYTSSNTEHIGVPLTFESLPDDYGEALVDFENLKTWTIADLEDMIIQTDWNEDETRVVKDTMAVI